MASTTTTTTTAAIATATAMSTKSQVTPGTMTKIVTVMPGMDMGGSTECKSSMFWNWYTLDACFLSKSWHIISSAMFVGSCIGVICLVLLLEFLRRLQREYDRLIARENQQRNSKSGNRSSDPEDPPQSAVSLLQDWANSLPSRESDNFPNITQQTVRALMHTLQFAVAYMIMLLAMYYNGYILICIFIGAFLGSFLFSWDGFGDANNGALSDTAACCA